MLIGRGMSKPSEIEFEQVDDTVRHEQFLQKKGLLRYKPAHEEVPIMVLQPRGETSPHRAMDRSGRQVGAVRL